MFARWRSEGITRGLLGGSRLWLALGVIAWTARALRWAWRRDVEVVAIKELEPGAQYLITQRPPTRRRGRAA